MKRLLSIYKKYSAHSDKHRDPGFLYFFLLLLLPVITSCTSEENINFNEVSILTLQMKIEGNSKTLTRVVKANGDDEWSFTDFSSGDKMGFYASGGNWLNQGSHVFDNQELIYNGENRFTTPEGEGNFSPSDMKGNEVYMYFPYCQDMNEQGLELRIEAEDGSLRCIDYLSANNLTMEGMQAGKPMAMFGTFIHTFSELIIMRGEGFDAPPANANGIDYSRITAVIDNGYTHIKVNFDTEDESVWSCNPELVYVEANGLTQSEAQRWNAWKGENYGITTEDPDGSDAWYVIVPTLGTSGTGRSSVDYIELYDNEGNLQRVSSLKLSGANTSNPTKYVDSGWRYPMEITMKELVPTVNPFPISRWEGNVDLSDVREYGINDITEFAQWVYDYNAYLSESSAENESKLMKYGDKIVTPESDEISWHFYILTDLDLSQYSPITTGEEVPADNTYILPTLKNATLDGQSPTLSGGVFLNYKITGLTKTFIGQMEKGQLQNLDFISPVVYDENNTNAMGILASSMKNSNVLNCNIEDGTLFNPKGAGGYIAGSAEGGSIKNCTLEGTLYAISTGTGNAFKIIGEEPIGTTFENNNVLRIVYSNN